MRTDFVTLGLSMGLMLYSSPVLAAGPAPGFQGGTVSLLGVVAPDSAPESEPGATPKESQPDDGGASAPESLESSEDLYKEGRHAYRLGNFAEAIERWERAYKLSELPQFLYNLSLAYAGLYRASEDIEHLYKARALMENYALLARSDEDADLGDAEERLAEFDRLIEEAAPPAAETEPPMGVDETPRQGAGRTLKIAGLASMAGGGVLVATGIGLGIYFGLRGREFDQQREEAFANRPDFCADQMSTSCMEQDAFIEHVRSDGRRANLGMGLSLGIGGGLGAIAVGVGAVLFIRGQRLERSSVAARIRVYPTGRGLGVSGRF